MLRPGFIYDSALKKWSIPLRHLIRLWNKLYPYVPLDRHTALGRVWGEFKQSEPTSLNKIAECITYITKEGNEERILPDSEIRAAS